MPTHSIQLLKLKDNYMTLFESILEVRLSEQAVRSVASQPSAQKCEAFNSLNNTETYQPLTELCSSAGFQNT